MLTFRQRLFVITPICKFGRDGRRGAYLFASKDKRIAFGDGYPEDDVQTLAQEISATWKPD